MGSLYFFSVCDQIPQIPQIPSGPRRSPPPRRRSNSRRSDSRRRRTGRTRGVRRRGRLGHLGTVMPNFFEISGNCCDSVGVFWTCLLYWGSHWCSRHFNFWWFPQPRETSKPPCNIAIQQSSWWGSINPCSLYYMGHVPQVQKTVHWFISLYHLYPNLWGLPSFLPHGWKYPTFSMAWPVRLVR